MSGQNNGKLLQKSCFDCVKSIESVYTGGKVAISKDESRLFTTCNEDIKILDIENGNKLAELKGDTEIITSFAVKPDGSHLVSASRSMQITIWDLSTFKPTRSFKAHEAPVISMDIDPTSTLVATGSADSTVKVWDIDRGYCTHNFKGHGGIITSVKFYKSNDTKNKSKSKLYLVSASDDGMIRVWNLNNRKCESVLESHVSVVRSICFTEDSDNAQKMITAGRDSVINVWNWKRKTLERTIPVYEPIESAGLLAPSTNIGIGDQEGDVVKNIIYSGGENGIIRLWDMDTGRQVFSQEKELNAKHTFVDVLYMPQAQSIVAVTNDQNILFYNATKKLQRTRQVVGYNEEIIDLAYVGANQKYLAVATNTEQLRIYDTENINCDLAYGHKDIVLCLDVSSNSAIVATGSKDNTAMIWAINMSAHALKRITCIAIAVGHTEAVGAVCLAKDDECSFMVTGSQDRTVKMWDLSPLKAILSTPAKAYEAVKSTGPIKLRSLYTFQAHDKDINSICISPDNKIFATGSQDKTAKVWDAATGKPLGTLKGHKRGVWNISFSPVDQVIATTSGDRTAKLWSLSDYSCLKTFEGHTNSVLCVKFLTMGTQLMTTGSDGLIKLWTIKNSECVLTLDKHEDKIWTLAKQDNEEFIATGGADSTIYIWEDTTQAKIDSLHKEQAELLEQQQALDNFLQAKDYRNAITLALSLQQPQRLLKIFEGILMATENRSTDGADQPDDENKGSRKTAVLGSPAIDDVVCSLAPDQLNLLLGYVRGWNTNSKFARVAQAVLFCILSKYSSQDILALSNAKELIAGLRPYTERHFSRLDNLLTDSFIIDYTMHAMDSLYITEADDMEE